MKINLLWFKEKSRNARRIAGLIAKSPLPNKTALLRAYLRLRLKCFLLVRILKRNIRNENLLGFDMKFFDYGSFIMVFREIFMDGDYYFVTDNPAPRIIDCGSNVGLSVIFFKKLYPDSRIIAFEPDEKTFGLLKRNVEANKLKNVTLINKAVYGQRGEMDFYYNKDYPGSVEMGAVKAPLLKDKKTVHTALLSEYITEDVDFLKLDIEGSEYAVIGELSQSRKLSLIKETVIECHHVPELLDAGGRRLLNILDENGFTYETKKPFPAIYYGKNIFLVHAYRKNTE